jgi:type III polyketide synthase
MNYKGWKVVLSPRVPKFATSVVPQTFQDLVANLPSLPPNLREAADFDWALHPGGATILSGVEKTMKISSEHMRASYDTYINHGNSSSATIFSVMDRLRQKDMDALAPGGKVKDHVVGCAFGPGIAIEMCLLKRNLEYVGREMQASGELTPPMTESEVESEGGRSDEEAEGEGEEVEREIEIVKEKGKELEEKLVRVGEGEGVKLQNGELMGDGKLDVEVDSLEEALNGVDLD